MKTPKELNALKDEAEALNGKLAELADEDLAQVSGGVTSGGMPEAVSFSEGAPEQSIKISEDGFVSQSPIGGQQNCV